MRRDIDLYYKDFLLEKDKGYGKNGKPAGDNAKNNGF